MENDDMIEALAPNGTNHPLNESSLPRRARRGQHFLNAHVSHLFSEVVAEDRVAVAQQVAPQLVKGKCLSQLLSRPFCSRVHRHLEVKNATTVMGQYQKHIKNLETNRGHSEEVYGDHLRDVIFQESAPALGRRLATAHHVFTDAALTEVDAEFEQLAVYARCAATRVLPAHPADQIPELARNDRWPRVAAAHLPGPEQAKAGAMPSHDSLWLDDGERRTPISPEAGQTDPQ